MMEYVIGRDFWEQGSQGYTLRQFWDEKTSQWVDFRQATRYPKPTRLSPDNPQEFSLPVG